MRKSLSYLGKARSIHLKKDKGSLLAAFKQTFTNDRLRQLLPEHMIIAYILSPSGKI
jgi:hypothetical protein